MLLSNQAFVEKPLAIIENDQLDHMADFVLRELSQVRPVLFLNEYGKLDLEKTFTTTKSYKYPLGSVIDHLGNTWYIQDIQIQNFGFEELPFKYINVFKQIISFLNCCISNSGRKVFPTKKQGKKVLSWGWLNPVKDQSFSENLFLESENRDVMNIVQNFVEIRYSSTPHEVCKVKSALFNLDKYLAFESNDCVPIYLALKFQSWIETGSFYRPQISVNSAVKVWNLFPRSTTADQMLYQALEDNLKLSDNGIEVFQLKAKCFGILSAITKLNEQEAVALEQAKTFGLSKEGYIEASLFIQEKYLNIETALLAWATENGLCQESDLMQSSKTIH